MPWDHGNAELTSKRCAYSVFQLIPSFFRFFFWCAWNFVTFVRNWVIGFRYDYLEMCAAVPLQLATVTPFYERFMHGDTHTYICRFYDSRFVGILIFLWQTSSFQHFFRLSYTSYVPLPTVPFWLLIPFDSFWAGSIYFLLRLLFQCSLAERQILQMFTTDERKVRNYFWTYTHKHKHMHLHTFVCMTVVKRPSSSVIRNVARSGEVLPSWSWKIYSRKCTYTYVHTYISTCIHMHMLAKRSFTCTTLGSGVVRA